jgi:hypothetical protein
MTWHGMRIDRGGDMRVCMSEALADVGQRHACREQVRAVRVAQRMEAGALRKLQAAEQQGDGGGDRVRLQRRAVRVAEDEIALITLAEVGSVFFLLLLVDLKLPQG